MTMPTSDGTTEEGEILGENTAAAAADPSFGVVNLGVHKYSSKTVAVPIELLQDSNADIEAFVNNRLITRLGASRTSTLLLERAVLSLPAY